MLTVEKNKNKNIRIKTDGISHTDVIITDSDGNVIEDCYEFTIHGRVGEATTCEIKLYCKDIDIVAEKIATENSDDGR